jgi:hypothetical protein
MPESNIPPELLSEINNFNSNANEEKLGGIDEEIDDAIENSESEEIIKMKAWKSETPSPLSGENENTNDEKSSGILSSLRKKAGKWGRGVLAATALSMGAEAAANENVKIDRPEIQATHKLEENQTSNGRVKVTTTESRMVGISYQDLANELLTTDMINFQGSTIKSGSLFRTMWQASLRDVYSQYQLYKKNPTPGLKEAITNNLIRLEKMVEGGKAPLKPELKQEFGLK